MLNQLVDKIMTGSESVNLYFNDPVGDLSSEYCNQNETLKDALFCGKVFVLSNWCN
jgi:hypothetical protein